MSGNGRCCSIESSSPLVSVIIPAYNAAAHVEAALRSALSQTYEHLEVIVVDDGSKDGTVDIVRSVMDEDDRVQQVRQSNQGVAAARNAAIRIARGTFIAPLDADDVWYPTKLERQVQRFQRSDADLGLVYTWWVSLDETGGIMWPSSKWDLEGSVHEALIVTNFIGNASVPLMRRSAVIEAGGYNEHLRAQGGEGCEDWDLALRIAERYPYGVVPDYLVGYRRVTGSMSADDSAMSTSYELVIGDVARRHPEIPASTFRWSKKHFFHWLSSRSYMRGDHAGALRWLARALYSDPSSILTKRVISTLVKSAAQAAASPMIRLLWTDPSAWIAARSRLRGRRPTVTTMDAVRRDPGHTPFTYQWKPWKPYDRICRRRWQSIMFDGVVEGALMGNGRSDPDRGNRRTTVPAECQISPDLFHD
jgi:glycosyltransferase involved in cell wall biosynthesis